MAHIIIKSKYAASVWDVKLIDKTKENIHSCGAYTVTAIAGVVKKSSTDFNTDSAVKLKGLNKKVVDNDCVINALIENTGLNRDELQRLAKSNSSDDWPLDIKIEFPNSPHSLLFVEGFKHFDKQSLAIDSMVRTGVLLPSQAKQLQKRFVRPIRSFMQQTAETIKSLKK